MVFNKIDRLEESNGLLAKLLEQYPTAWACRPKRARAWPA